MKYREIEADILRKYLAYIVSLDPILNQIGSVRTLHAGGFRYQINEKEAVTPLNKISFTIEISHDAISEYDLGAFTQSIYEFTEHRVTEMHRMMYRTLDTVTSLTGNVVNTKGQPPNADMILDIIEKTEMRFDANGELIKQSFIAGPDMIKQLASIKFTPEQEERHNRIIERKKKEFYVKKCYRRLSYVN
jgi:hypothetical protein